MLTVAETYFDVVSGASLRRYQFGTHTAGHFFCGICGNTTHNRRRSDTSVFGVNAGGIDGVDLRALNPVWFDGVNDPSDRG